MPGSYLFGGASTDDVTFTAEEQLTRDNASWLVAGWWYPSTLTAGRGYWSAGDICSARVDTTTSEIRLVFDGATTDGEYTTSGLGMVTDLWQFLAFFGAMESSGNLAGLRVWRATVNDYPAILTPSEVVAPAGNWASSAALTLGNIGTGSAAFQGNIGWGHFAQVRNIGINGPFSTASSGVVTDDVARNVETRWVAPLWQGRPIAEFRPPTATTQWHFAHLALDGNPALASLISQDMAQPAHPAVTINGATPSDLGVPRSLPRSWVFGNQQRVA
jgi:hypothetical protein